MAEHSWRMTLMAMLLEDEFPDTDINKVIKMCLIHDLGEAFTGDEVNVSVVADDDGLLHRVFSNEGKDYIIAKTVHANMV